MPYRIVWKQCPQNYYSNVSDQGIVFRITETYWQAAKTSKTYAHFHPQQHIQATSPELQIKETIPKQVMKDRALIYVTSHFESHSAQKQIFAWKVWIKAKVGEGKNKRKTIRKNNFIPGTVYCICGSCIFPIHWIFAKNHQQPSLEKLNKRIKCHLWHKIIVNWIIVQSLYCKFASNIQTK